MKDEQGRTALSWAAQHGHDHTVDILLASTALVDEDDKHGRTPLWWAAECGHASIVHLLLYKGKSTSAERPDKEGETPLIRAAKGDHVAALISLTQYIIMRKDGPTHDDSHTFVVSHVCNAAKEGWTEFVHVLMKTNAIRDPASDYREPLCLAGQMGHTGIVNLLLEAGADPNSELNGDTVLYRSFRAGNEDIVKLLFDSGASTRKQSSSGSLEDLVNDNRTLWTLLRAATKEGRLAETEEDTNPDTDKLFKATICSFKVHQDMLKFETDHISVKDLLENPHRRLSKHDASLQWIHLPANNVSISEGMMLLNTD